MEVRLYAHAIVYVDLCTNGCTMKIVIEGFKSLSQ